MYWIHRDGENHGPYSSEQLAEYCDQGLISGTEQVWDSGESRWVSTAKALGIEPESGEIPAESTSDLVGRAIDQLAEPGRLGRAWRGMIVGIKWVPIMSALLVGSLGFASLINSRFFRELNYANDDVEALAIMAGIGLAQYAGEFIGGSFGLSAGRWLMGLIVGGLNGIFIGAMMGWIIGYLRPPDSVGQRVLIFALVGGACGHLLNTIFWDGCLVLLIGFLSWKEGILLGFFYFLVCQLETAPEVRPGGAVSSASSASREEASPATSSRP